jgi:hypothetical protein
VGCANTDRVEEELAPRVRRQSQQVAEELADDAPFLFGDPVQHAGIGQVGRGVAGRKRGLGRGPSGEIEVGSLLGEVGEHRLVTGPRRLIVGAMAARLAE